MKFHLEIDCANAAFEDATLSEFRRFLSMNLADQAAEDFDKNMDHVKHLRQIGGTHHFKDSNGNTVCRIWWDYP